MMYSYDFNEPPKKPCILIGIPVNYFHVLSEMNVIRQSYRHIKELCCPTVRYTVWLTGVARDRNSHV